MALIGVPSQFRNVGFNEYLGFNAGRIYGEIQLSHLFANWKQGIEIYLWLNNYRFLQRYDTIFDYRFTLFGLF